MLRIILTRPDGRTVRDEQFDPIDERDIPKSVARAVKAALREPARPGESVEFRLVLIRFH